MGQKSNWIGTLRVRAKLPPGAGVSGSRSTCPLHSGKTRLARGVATGYNSGQEWKTFRLRIDERRELKKATKRQLAMLRALRGKKERTRTGLFLVEGVRLCEELADTGLEVESILVSEERLKDERCGAVIDGLESVGAEVFEATEWQVEKVSDTVHCQGILAAARWRDQALADVALPEKARILALDAVSDPGNVGAVIRTAAWFGVTAVLLGHGCADLLNPKTVRATMGGLFHLPVLRDVALCDAVKELLTRKVTVSVAAVDGTPAWRTWCETERCALILGSEARGAAPELRALAQHALAIPGPGRGESLNVAVSAGIFLSALLSQSV